MERKKEEWEIRDPKLPRINARHTGNGMENRRADSPLPQNLPNLAAEQNLSM